MPETRRSALAALFGGLLAVVSARGEAWHAEPVLSAGVDEAVPLDAQRCNTECQNRFTQCLLDCDGSPSCMQGCKQTNASCVAGCSAPELLPSGKGPVAPSPGSAAPSAPSAPGSSASPPTPPPKPSAAPTNSANPPAAPKLAGTE